MFRESFFVALAAWYKLTYPKATPEIVEHVISLERNCWLACAFGVSYKAKKVQLAQAMAKMLGEFLGRGVRQKDPAKLKLKRRKRPHEVLLQGSLSIVSSPTPS